MPSKELYDFEAVIRHETEKAVLLDIGKDDPLWFSKSTLQDNHDGTFTVPMWLAVKAGMA